MEIVNLITALFCAFMVGMFTSNLVSKPQISKDKIYIWLVFYIVCCILNTICVFWI